MPVTVNATDVQRIAAQLGRVAKDAPRAFARAMVSIGRAAGTETRRAATAVYNVKQADVSERMRVDVSPIFVLITGRKKPFTLHRYGARQTRKGIAARVFRGGRRETFRRGFFPPKFGGKVPFERLTEKRFPIDVLYGPSVADMLNNPKVVTPLQEKLLGRARAELTRRISRELARRG